MGATYTNFTVRGSNQSDVTKALTGRKSFVSPEKNGCVVVFEEESDNQDQEQIANTAAELSADLHCTVLALLIHDSDILWYQLYENGILTDQYNSTPDYWSSQAEPSLPEGGDAKRLCAAFGSTAITELERILRAPFAREGYVDAWDRHTDLVRALNLPEFAVGNAYGGVVAGYVSNGLSKETLTSST